MVKLALAALTATLVATLSIVAVTGASSADAAAPCKAKKVETKWVQDLCKAGGQKAVKDEMKKAMKKWKKVDASVPCASCHSKVGGDYPKKKDALEKLQKFGVK